MSGNLFRCRTVLINTRDLNWSYIINKINIHHPMLFGYLRTYKFKKTYFFDKLRLCFIRLKIYLESIMYTQFNETFNYMFN